MIAQAQPRPRRVATRSWLAWRRMALLARFLAVASVCVASWGGTLIGTLRDENWFARYQSNPFGVGYYEFAINGNASNNAASVGLAAATSVFGEFTNSVAAGLYTVASWDVWWRSAFAFNVRVPVSGATPRVDLRLRAAMWGYPAFWDERGYSEFGQTFTATGPIVMIYLRNPLDSSMTHTVTVLQGSPSGARLGVTRTFSGQGDHRLIYGYGDMPTEAGKTYYLRIRTPSTSQNGVIMQMDPRPDFSDPMPGGCLWVGPQGNVTAQPDRDLGLVVMCDDDGLLTNLYTRSNGATPFTSTSIGQSFIARGVNLISVAVWIADPAAPTYAFRILKGGPGGEQTGKTKLAKPARVTADPELMATWSPGECPLEPGQAYYLEVTRATGGTVNSANVNSSNPYPHGQAYRNGSPVTGVDLAGTIMEERSAGEATRATIQFLSEPLVAEADRATNSLTLRWSTDIPARSQVEYALGHPPYNRLSHRTNLTTEHVVTLDGLRPHSMYHYRVRCEAEGVRDGLSRDFVICTRAARTNLLKNPGFEDGTGASPRKPVPSWTGLGGVDLAASDGTWFHGLKPHSGRWLLEGAVNGGSSDGAIYQRVAVSPGKEYTFSAWVSTWPRENNTWKYDVWNAQGRLIFMRLGIDPRGGVDPNAASVLWTPRLYSHLHYSNLAKSAVALANTVTVFISMKGEGVQWHLYGVDDCVLTESTVSRPVLESPSVATGAFEFQLVSDPGRACSIQVSEDLARWSTVETITNLSGVFQWREGGSPVPARRFYRAVAQ